VGTLPNEVGLMPSMDWEDFQRDHHRPHVLIVSMEAKKPKHALAKADFNRLILRLGSVGNYAIKADGTTMYIAFEDDADANRLASILRPERTTREAEWASKSWATIDGATHRRIAGYLKKTSVTSKRRRSTPR